MEKRKIVFYLTIGMILILHLTACTNRSSELPAPDSTVLDMREKQKIIFDGVCAEYNDKKEKNQVFLPIVQVLGTYEEGNITKISFLCVINRNESRRRKLNNSRNKYFSDGYRNKI